MKEENNMKKADSIPSTSRNTKTATTDYVHVWKYSEEQGVPEQVIYRKIREGKITEGDFIFKEKVVKRLYIAKSLKLDYKPRA